MAMNADWHSMRASDADRERAADVLKAALAEGRIDMAEHKRRVSALMTSHTYGEIHRLIADLPAGPSPFPSASPNPRYPATSGSSGHPNPWAHYAPNPIRPVDPLAKASLILGAVTPLTCGVSGIPAIVTGHMALNRIRDTGDDGRGLAIAGLSIGYITIVMGLLSFVLFVVGLAAS